MGVAILNSLAVSLPATILSILLAAFAGYAFAWLDFPGRFALFAILVSLQVVPLQLTLVPISRLYAQSGLNGTFQAVWLFRTGFCLPYAIYLMRNFLSGLPRDLFEAAYLDGANHWTAFTRNAIPLSMPAIASLTIYQFLWVWNDLLVALVFLGGAHPVVTYQVGNLVTFPGRRLADSDRSCFHLDAPSSDRLLFHAALLRQGDVGRRGQGIVPGLASRKVIFSTTLSAPPPSSGCFAKDGGMSRLDFI